MSLLFGFFSLFVGTYFWFNFMRKRDKFEPEPIRALLFVLLIGGGLSALAASIGNEVLNGFSDGSMTNILSQDMGVSSFNVLSVFLFSAFIEEICKYSAAFLLIRKNKEVNEPIDGVIYSVAVGLGFSFFENILYLLMHGGVVTMFRVILAVPLHMATAAIWGIYFSNSLAQKRSFVFLNAAPLVLLAVVFHAAWNSSAALLGGIFIILAPFVLRYCLKRVDAEINKYHELSPFNPSQNVSTQAYGISESSTTKLAPAIFCQDCQMELSSTYRICPRCGGRNIARASVSPNFQESASQTEVQVSSDQSAGDRAYEILPNGKKRYFRATWVDMILSALLPLWGFVVGVFALSKGEKTRGATMIAIGAAMVMVTVVLNNA